MRTRALLIFFGFIVVGLVLIWFFRPIRPRLQAGKLEEVHEQTIEYPTSAQLHAEQQLSDSQRMDTQTPKHDPPNTLQTGLDQWKEELHRPIEFFGKVLDENERPLEGAMITFIWTQFYPESSFTTNVFSDHNGLFSLGNATGAGLSVYVEKSGYYIVKSLNQNSFEYSRRFVSEPFQPNPNGPVVFHLRKKGLGEELITSQYGISPDFHFAVPLDGTPVFVNLLDRKVGNTGHLEISQRKPSYATWKQAGEWSFRMGIRDGGLIEQRDEFPFEAPESGYKPVVQFDFQQGQTNWATHLAKDYYIKFGNPPRFGRLHMETSIMMNGVRLTYAINPTGSRNLEPKENAN